MKTLNTQLKDNEILQLCKGEFVDVGRNLFSWGWFSFKRLTTIYRSLQNLHTWLVVLESIFKLYSNLTPVLWQLGHSPRHIEVYVFNLFPRLFFAMFIPLK